MKTSDQFPDNLDTAPDGPPQGDMRRGRGRSAADDNAAAKGRLKKIARRD